MFQRCGGSGSPNREFPRERAYEDPSELKIHTLESTYRDPLPARYNFINCRQYVSDSNIFMHRDEDWYREPKPPSGSSNFYHTSTDFNVVNSRYPTIDVATIETVNVNVGSSNRLNKFKTLFGIDQNVQTSEDPTEPSKLKRFKNIFKRKNVVSIEAPPPVVNLTSEDRIVRMKTLFGNKPLRPKEEEVPKQPKSLLQMKTLFKKDASCQTDDVTNKHCFEKIFCFKKTNADEEKVDDRQIFSRQSSIPAREEDQKSRLPLCWQSSVKWIRASLTRSRVDDVEIPDCTSDLGTSKKKKTVKFGKASSWRWRPAQEPHTQPASLHENFTQVSANHDNIIY